MNRWPGHASLPDGGSGSVLALGLVCVIAIAASGALMLGGAVLAKARAQTAADLSALACAQELLDHRGEAAALQAARQMVQAHGATLVSCAPAGLRCQVVAASQTSPLAGRTMTARAKATAGHPRATASTSRNAAPLSNI
ncbi:MAG: flp pilus-assembly TadE/G-like family protein [Bifidobacteriaceae bacterium]|jgi:secretion/DNA translocation related TadE-like protein|nr:flp pilus-assembly TadE/G-like family protein [Bifidobacteriaceae bacterium]